METTDQLKKKNLHVYLCFGQSNMEGAGAIEEVDKQADERFLFLQPADCPDLGRKKGEWYAAVPPLFHCDTGLSLANVFGKTMIENLPDEISVAVVPVAIGGCDIRLFDKDEYKKYLRSYEEDWYLNKVRAYGENPYGLLIELARKAQKKGVIKGILLHQGETNNGDSHWPAYVRKIYENIIKDLNLNARDVPLLAGQVIHSEQGGICASMNPIIDSLPRHIPTAHVISSRGCSIQKDNLHFDSEGNRELGRRYARKMLSLIAG